MRVCVCACVDECVCVWGHDGRKVVQIRKLRFPLRPYRTQRLLLLLSLTVWHTRTHTHNGSHKVWSLQWLMSQAKPHHKASPDEWQATTAWRSCACVCVCGWGAPSKPSIIRINFESEHLWWNGNVMLYYFYQSDSGDSTLSSSISLTHWIKLYPLFCVKPFFFFFVFTRNHLTWVSSRVLLLLFFSICNSFLKWKILQNYIAEHNTWLLLWGVQLFIAVVY